MPRVDRVEAEPLAHREIAQGRVLHEQVVRAHREQFALDLVPQVEPPPEAGLGGGPLDPRRGRRALRGAQPGRKPAQPEDEELAELGAERGRPARHRRLGPSPGERRRARLQPQREVLDDLRRRPFPRRRPLPVGLGATLERAQHERGKLRERAHGSLKNRRRTWSPCSSHSSSCSRPGRRPLRHQKRKRPPPATCWSGVAAKNWRISGVNSARIAGSSGPLRRYAREKSGDSSKSMSCLPKTWPRRVNPPSGERTNAGNGAPRPPAPLSHTMPAMRCVCELLPLPVTHLYSKAVNGRSRSRPVIV